LCLGVNILGTKPEPAAVYTRVGSDYVIPQEQPILPCGGIPKYFEYFVAGIAHSVQLLGFGLVDQGIGL
jgi:hypothetical protein